jgi:hypothetical protein
MSNLPIDRLSKGYAMPFTEQIKYAIRSMTYGELMEMSEGLVTPGENRETDIKTAAQKLWEWANAPLKTEDKQTEER